MLSRVLAAELAKASSSTRSSAAHGDGAFGLNDGIAGAGGQSTEV